MEPITAARPYAKALFELAVDESRLVAWSQVLALLSEAAQQPSVAAVIGHPALTHAELANLLCEVLHGKLDAEGQNLVRLLAENGRLELIPLIRDEFEQLKAAAEKSAAVEIATATAVDAAQQQTLAEAVRRRMGLDVKVVWKTEPELIAGAVIRAGDLVIDGSASGELERLRHALAA